MLLIYHSFKLVITSEEGESENNKIFGEEEIRKTNEKNMERQTEHP
jgi:hypothetical protein